MLAEATLSEIVLVPCAPEMRLGLDAVARIPGTPGPAATSTPDTATPTAPATQPAAQEVSPPTGSPATATTTTAPTATGVPTSVITIAPAETPEGAAPAPSTPAPTATSAATATTVAIVTSVATATASAAATGIEPGSTVITGIGEANVREGPSLDAAIIVTIPLGTELVVTGPSVPGDDMIWWPVSVVDTGQEGCVAEDLLILAEEG